MKNETIFEFIRFSLDEKATDFAHLDDLDWEALYSFAEKHFIAGVLYPGLKKLSKVKKPPMTVAANWYAQTEMIRELNEILNRNAVTVYQQFKKDGLKGCVLKGQGVAALYPDPYARNPGDIDIWIDADKQTIIDYVNRVCPGQRQRYIHIDFPLLKDVETEVHFTPSYMYAPWANRKLQRWFKEQADEQFANMTCLPGSSEQVCIPTVGFNRIFMLSHLYKHLFSEGIGLRQLMDYYFLLKCGATEAERAEAVATIQQLGMYKFATAVMYVLQKVLGLEDGLCLVKPDEQAGEFLLSEILLAGNFGQSDTRFGGRAKNESVAHRYFRLSRRNLHFISDYPSEAICEPFFRTWFFFWKLFNVK
jgi:hypothetical protein